jgi:hypothetical protein
MLELGRDRESDAVAAASRRPQTLSFLSALLPAACRQAFRIYRIVLLGWDFCRLKSPPSSTHVLMKTGYLPASLSAY